MSERHIEKMPGYDSVAYLERAGVETKELADVLASPPEFPLTLEQRDEAYAFENEIFAHEIRDGRSVGFIIRNDRGEAAEAPLFFPQAFVEGRIHIEDVDMPQFESFEEVYIWLARIIQDKTIPIDILLQLAKESSEWYKTEMVEALTDGEEVFEGWLECKSFIADPEHFIEKFSDAISLRKYLLELRSVFHEGDDLVDGAKRAIVDVYLARVNSMIASDIPMADFLREQTTYLGYSADSIEDEHIRERKKREAHDLDQRAREIIPYGFRNALEHDTQRTSIFRRLDFVRNGIGYKEEGGASSVSHLVERAVQQREEVNEMPHFTPEQTKLLKETMLEPAEIRSIMSQILEGAGMLSNEPSETWNSERIVRAADNLFQVVENKKSASSFAVEGKTGVYKVPTVPRSLYDVLVVGGFHELTHVNQMESDNALARKMRLASLKGKRVSMLRESGANAQQRAAEKKWFGVSKPFALTYARALQALERGENLQGATKAFYEEKRNVMPDVSKQVAAREAADRVLRLTRQGGISSSAMSYAEDGLFVAELEGADSETRQRATNITTFDLVDQVRLHRYGLLPETNEPIDWTPHIEEVLMPYIVRALGVAPKNL